MTRLRDALSAFLRRHLGRDAGTTGKIPPRPPPTASQARPTPSTTNGYPQTNPEELFGDFLRNHAKGPQAPPQVGTTQPTRTASGATGGNLALLEANLRNAILDRDTREHLIADAMKRHGKTRASAIKQVLDDQHAENQRWS